MPEPGTERSAGDCEDASRADVTAVAARWVARRADGEGWSRRDEDELRAWLEADPRHRREFEILCAIQEASAQAGRGAVGRPLSRERHGGAGGWRWGRRPIAQASVMAAVVVAALGAWVTWRSAERPVFKATYTTRVGGFRGVDLPEGSRVELDTDTALSVELTDERRVVRLLHGRAVFSVTPEADRPFIVRTAAGDVRVVGTRFQVSRDARRREVRVAVLEGEVRVVPAGSGASAARVGGGEAIRFIASGIRGPMERVDADTFATWRAGWIVFEDRPLEAVVAEMNRYFPQRVRVASERLRRTRISGSFSVRDLSEFFAAVQQLLLVRVRRVSDREIVIEAAD